MKTAIVYARFSPRPDGATCESIEMQQERCAALCVAKGWEQRMYSDREISGKRADNRPGLQAALKDVCREKGVLVVYSLSRLSRSTRDCLEIVERLKECDAELCSLSESIDTGTPAGRMMFTLVAAFAQLEREQTAVRTSDALQRKKKAGLKYCRIPPYGYRIDPTEPTRLEKEEHEQECIRRISYWWLNETKSLTEIVQRLNDLSIKPRAARWHRQTVKNILLKAEVWTPSVRAETIQ